KPETKKPEIKKPEKKKPEEKKSESGLQDLYSKKNWSKLEFGKTPTAEISNAAPVQAPAPKPPEAKVKIPVVRNLADIPPLPPMPDEDEMQSPEPQRLREPQILSVSDLNKHIRSLLEGEFPLVWLKAEISNFKAHTSGHFYFSLKDSKAQISAVMFRGFNSQLRFRPEDGMEVLVRGKITVFEPRGNYQIFCESMEPVGAGALQKAFEQLKAKLQKEGLFDAAKKRALPALPKHIAIVTSPTGAAIRDMLNVLGRRFKGVHITVIPCKVQGDQAPAEICAAIAMANKLKDVDVMIIGRGGGSIEDLWAFNDERVARAIASARVPTISAVGHEIDFTIADFVADLRAPTPSAAAELVVKHAGELSQQIAQMGRSISSYYMKRVTAHRQHVMHLSKRLVDPQRKLQDAAIRCDELLQRLESETLRAITDREMKVQILRGRLGTPTSRITRERDFVQALRQRMRTGVRVIVQRKTEGFQKQAALLDSLSPLKVLDRGYSMVSVGSHIVTDASELKPGQTIEIRMGRGTVEADVKKVSKK
ncbi:MAG: exodeoxyribonuclease VII large subunit, partial [Bdellovibrionota bacterium]